MRTKNLGFLPVALALASSAPAVHSGASSSYDPIDRMADDMRLPRPSRPAEPVYRGYGARKTAKPTAKAKRKNSAKGRKAARSKK